MKKILNELYLLDPSLKEYEADLIVLIGRMSELKPGTRFDADFAKRLRKEVLLLKAVPKPEKKSFTFNLILMNKRMYAAVGSVAVLGMVAALLLLSRDYRPGQPAAINSGFSRLAVGAFGSLKDLSANTGTESAGTLASGGGANPTAAHDNSVAASDVAVSNTAIAVPRTAIAAPVAATTNGTAVATGAAKMMILPMVNFKYSYVGEPLTLTEAQGDVLRRVKGAGQLSQDLARLISSQDLTMLDISSFRNLKMTNLTLSEDKDQGLTITLDLIENSINIFENWEKWRVPERDACGNDSACWDKYRLKIEDVPSDNDLIAFADKFLADHKIDRAHYGEAQVDNNWREVYAQTENKNDAYVPEYTTVVYPLLINGAPVREQDGSYYGLRVTINILKKAASGLNGLTPFAYETSSYALATDASDVIKAAEKGGYNSGYLGGNGEVKTIELGTPTRSYVQVWKYSDNRNNELLIPALIFPIVKAPKDYYGQKSIMVPLVKDMLDEISTNRTEPSSGPSSSGSSGSPVEPVQSAPSGSSGVIMYK